SPQSHRQSGIGIALQRCRVASPDPLSISVPLLLPRRIAGDRLDLSPGAALSGNQVRSASPHVVAKPTVLWSEERSRACVPARRWEMAGFLSPSHTGPTPAQTGQSRVRAPGLLPVRAPCIEECPPPDSFR